VRGVPVDRREDWIEDEERQQRDLPGGTLTPCDAQAG
jgi:hypothetical protein